MLTKMKDQQKHSCSCSVFNRKRVLNIEDQLEDPHDAYFRELHTVATYNLGDGINPTADTDIDDTDLEDCEDMNA